MRDKTSSDKSSVELAGREVVLDPVFTDGDQTVPIWSANITSANYHYYIKGVNHGTCPMMRRFVRLSLKLFKAGPPRPRLTRTQQLHLLLRIVIGTSLNLCDLHSSLKRGSYRSRPEQRGRLGFDSYRGVNETLTSGTFLSVDGVEYASIQDGSKNYQVQVNGTSSGDFTLTINITRNGVIAESFSYPNVPVGIGTIAQLSLNPSTVTSESLPSLSVNTGAATTSVRAVDNLKASSTPETITLPASTPSPSSLVVTRELV